MGQLEHQRFILLRHAEDAHDHPQRIPNSNVFDEVAFTAHIRHAVNILVRQLVHPRLELAQIAPHEPALGQHPVLHMIRIVHLYQRAHQVFTTGHLLHHLLHHLQTEGWARIVNKQLLLSLDLFDVVIARHVPERRIPLWRELLQGRIFPQPRKLIMHPLLVSPIGWVY